jgi:hypothetical protein
MILARDRIDNSIIIPKDTPPLDAAEDDRAWHFANAVVTFLTILSGFANLPSPDACLLTHKVA